ncbi:MAG: hypothetical protein JSU94_01615 [Phycisphaerales bacterium]|nr:MAG: hypothetical protein JSU94_01615 [Phycisphaerales bacterium]
MPSCKERQAPVPADDEVPTVRAEFPIAEEFPIVLPAQLDKTECRFILDTGCSVTSFNDTFKDRLGKYIETQTSSGSMWQKVAIDIYEIPRNPGLIVGPFKLVGKVGVTDYANFGAWVDEYDGLLGIDFMKPFIVQLDFEDNLLLLVKGDTEPAPEWGAPFDLQFDGGTPHLQVRLTETVSELFMIDTASRRTYLIQGKFERLLHELRPDRPYVKREITADTKVVSGVVLKDFRLGPLTYERLRITEYPRSFLGMDFLRKHSLVTFDFSRKKLYLKKHASSSPAPADLQYHSPSIPPVNSPDTP